jgi:hypothetical protein
MENKKDFLIRVFGGVIIIVLLTIIAIRQPHDMIPPPIETCKQDSLQNVINELQMDLKMQSDGFDSKERRYEDVIFEYEYGIDHLKIINHKHIESFIEFYLTKKISIDKTNKKI